MSKSSKPTLPASLTDAKLERVVMDPKTGEDRSGWKLTVGRTTWSGERKALYARGFVPSGKRWYRWDD